MQLLARINAGGTTVRHGHPRGRLRRPDAAPRDRARATARWCATSAHGGYGDTSGHPEPRARAGARARLRSPRSPPCSNCSARSSNAEGRSSRRGAAAAVTAAERGGRAPLGRTTVAQDAPEPPQRAGRIARRRSRRRRSRRRPGRRRATPHGDPLDIAEVDVAELGLADRLGLPTTDRRRSGADVDENRARSCPRRSAASGATSRW